MSKANGKAGPPRPPSEISVAPAPAAEEQVLTACQRRALYLWMSEIYRILVGLPFGRRAELSVRLVVEDAWERDLRVPLVSEDDDCDCGWRCVPVQPTSDERWAPWDTSHDRKTGWRRIQVLVEDPGP